MMAEIQDLQRRIRALGGRVEQDFYDAIDDVLYISEVAEVFAPVEKLQGLSFADRPREERRRHVRPPPRAVNGKKAQARDVERVIQRVAVGHELVGLLRRTVIRDRLVSVVVSAKGWLRARAVNAAA